MSYTEQIIKISIEGVATKIETVLNIISTVLFQEGKISQEYKFDIDIEKAKYIRKSKLSTKDKVTALIHLVDRNFIAEDYTNYTEIYTINFCTNWDNLEDINKILADYQAYEFDKNKVEYINISGVRYNINKINTSYDILPKDNANDGTGEDKAYLYLMTTWNIMSGIADSEDIVVKIDDKELPQMGLVHDISKVSLSTKERTVLGFNQSIPSSTIDTVTLVLPYIPSHEKINEIFLDSRSKTLINKKYKVEVTISGNKIIDGDYYISASTFSDDKPSPIIFGVSFISDFPTQKIFIKKKEQDETEYKEMILYSYTITKSYNTDKTPILNKDNDNVKSIPISYTRVISLSTPIIPGSYTDDLEVELLNDNVESLYDIKIIKNISGNSLEFEYNLNIADISIETTLNPQGTLIVVLEEREDF